MKCSCGKEYRLDRGKLANLFVPRPNRMGNNGGDKISYWKADAIIEKLDDLLVEVEGDK